MLFILTLYCFLEAPSYMCNAGNDDLLYRSPGGGVDQYKCCGDSLVDRGMTDFVLVELGHMTIYIDRKNLFLLV